MLQKVITEIIKTIMTTKIQNVTQNKVQQTPFADDENQAENTKCMVKNYLEMSTK